METFSLKSFCHFHSRTKRLDPSRNLLYFRFQKLKDRSCIFFTEQVPVFQLLWSLSVVLMSHYLGGLSHEKNRHCYGLYLLSAFYQTRSLPSVLLLIDFPHSGHPHLETSFTHPFLLSLPPLFSLLSLSFLFRPFDSYRTSEIESLCVCFIRVFSDGFTCTGVRRFQFTSDS